MKKLFCFISLAIMTGLLYCGTGQIKQASQFNVHVTTMYVVDYDADCRARTTLLEISTGALRNETATSTGTLRAELSVSTGTQLARIILIETSTGTLRDEYRTSTGTLRAELCVSTGTQLTRIIGVETSTGTQLARIVLLETSTGYLTTLSTVTYVVNLSTLNYLDKSGGAMTGNITGSNYQITFGTVNISQVLQLPMLAADPIVTSTGTMWIRAGVVYISTGMGGATSPLDVGIGKFTIVTP